MSAKGDTLLVGGIFNDVSGLPASNFAAYHNGRWCVNTEPVDNPISDVCSFFGKVYISGGFKSIGGVAVDKLARVTSFGPFQSVGVNQTIGEIGLRMYPNPAAGRLHIISETGAALRKISVSDMSGRLLLSKELSGTETEVQLLGRGILMVDLETTQGHYRSKITQLQ